MRKRLEWSSKEHNVLLEGLEAGLTKEEIATRLKVRTPSDVYFHVLRENQRREKEGQQLLVLQRSPRKKQHYLLDNDELSDTVKVTTHESTTTDEGEIESKSPEEPSRPETARRRHKPPLHHYSLRGKSSKSLYPASSTDSETSPVVENQGLHPGRRKAVE